MNLQEKENTATSPMLKLAKRMEKIKKPISVDRIAYLFPCWGRGGGGGGGGGGGAWVSFILEFILDFWKDNSVMSG